MRIAAAGTAFIVLGSLVLTGCASANGEPSDSTLASPTRDPRYVEPALSEKQLQKLCKTVLDDGITASESKTADSNPSVPETTSPVTCGEGAQYYTDTETSWTIEGHPETFLGVDAYFAADRGPASRSVQDLPATLTEKSCADGYIGRQNYGPGEMESSSVETMHGHKYCAWLTNNATAGGTEVWRTYKATFVDRQTTVQLTAVATWDLDERKDDRDDIPYKKDPKLDKQLGEMASEMLSTTMKKFKTD